MSHNPKSTKRGEAWPSSSSESVTNRDAEKIKDAERVGKCRSLTNGTGHGGEVADETNYRRGKKEKKRGRGAEQKQNRQDVL